MFSTILMFLTALTLSGVAAWFSIVGMIAIFSAAPLSVAIMAGSLEAAKLVCASWVYNNWRLAPKLIKSYLTVAVLILMFITSLGIFGYLSKAHLEQRSNGAESQLELSRLQLDIDTKEKQMQRLMQTEDRLNNAIDRMVERDRVTQALSQRRRLQGELKSIGKERRELQKEIDALYVKKIPLELENKKMEVEIGPLKYIAELIYGEQARSHFDQAVRFVIILLVSVFDPLAVSMLIAANFGLRSRREQESQAAPQAVQVSEPPEEPEPAVVKQQAVVDEPTLPEPTPPKPTLPEPPPPVEAIAAEPTPSVETLDADKTSRVRQAINQRVIRLGPGYASLDGKPVSDSARREVKLDQDRVTELVTKLLNDTITVQDLTWAECEAVLAYLEK